MRTSVMTHYATSAAACLGKAVHFTTTLKLGNPNFSRSRYSEIRLALAALVVKM
jgi:hypothetical protein